MPLNGQIGSKITSWIPYIQSSNPVVACSNHAGGASIMSIQQPDLKLIRILTDRLERISADSVWAHRASGVRGTLLNALDELENLDTMSSDAFDEAIKIGMEILKAAAKEKTGG